MTPISFHQKLVKVQSEIKVLKENRNNFGNYNYRSCEDILYAIKPILAKYELTLKLTDSIELVGQRYYIKAIAEISDGDRVFSNSALAREAEKQSGMSDAQLTGSSSSYARKYALAGLLGLDDEKDPDTQEPKEPTRNTVTPRQFQTNDRPASDKQKELVKKHYPSLDVSNLTMNKASELIQGINKGK